MKSELFNFEDTELKVFTSDDETIWFVAKDVCEILGLANVSKALNTIPERGKLTLPMVMSGQKRNVILINEPSLYRLIAKSKKEAAIDFQDWVFEKVLPSIRKTGSYTPKKELTPKQEALILATQLIESEKKNVELETEVKQLQPKADFHDTVAASKDLIPLSQFGLVSKVGFKKIFDFCREHSFIYTSNNKLIPYTRYITQGLFKLKEYTYVDKHGEGRAGVKIYITGKGQSALLNIMNKSKQMELM